MTDGSDKRPVLNDEGLAQLFDSVAPEEVTVDPWRRPVRMLILGILLTTVTLNFWRLDTILPCVGTVVLCLAFRALRQENGWFRLCYVISILRLMLTAFFLALDGLPAPRWEPDIIVAACVCVLQLARLFAMREGFADVFRRAGEEPDLGPLNWLIGCSFLLFLASVAGVGDMGILGILPLAAYVAVVVSLCKLPGRLADTGYALRNAPVRLGDWQTAVLLLLALAAVTFGSWCIGTASAVPDAESFEPGVDDSLTGSVPDEVLELLTPEDAAKLHGARKIDFSWGEYHPFPDGTQIRCCTVSAEMAGYKLEVIQYFEYMSGSPRYGDGFSCWATHALRLCDAPTGRVAYQLEGEEYVSPLTYVNGGASGVTSLFFGNSTEERIYGGVNTPCGAEKVRGYVMYPLMEAQNPGKLMNYNLDIDMLHTGFMQSYGNSSPWRRLMSGQFDYKWRSQHVTFFTSFDYEEEGE